jgi:hypothetical protein
MSVVVEFVDKGITGAVESRPELNRLMDGRRTAPATGRRMARLSGSHSALDTPRVLHHALAAQTMAVGREPCGRCSNRFRCPHLSFAGVPAVLKRLRQQLPPYRLGITGLLDWSSRITPDQVNELRGTVDEVVVQTYQGRQTIENYGAYLPGVCQLTLPFNIGLIQNGNWEAPEYFAKSAWFRGCVVFLQNRRGN